MYYDHWYCNITFRMSTCRTIFLILLWVFLLFIRVFLFILYSECQHLCRVLAFYPYEPLPAIAFHKKIKFYSEFFYFTLSFLTFSTSFSIHFMYRLSTFVSCIGYLSIRAIAGYRISCAANANLSPSQTMSCSGRCDPRMSPGILLRGLVSVMELSFYEAAFSSSFLLVSTF